MASLSQADRPRSVRVGSTHRSAYWLIVFVILLATGALYGRIWEDGVRLLPDSARYLGAAIHLAEGQGLVTAAYAPATDTVQRAPLTQHPPLTSVVYAGLIRLGVSPARVPTVLALLCWPLLLAGIALLAYRLAQSAWVALGAVVVAACSTPFWFIYTRAWSEVLFLPLLVGAIALLHGLPEKKQGSSRWLWASVLLLGLLMLTRYSGVFIYGGVGLWWIWHRGRARAYGVLVKEIAILAVAAVPLALFILRNAFLTEAPLGAAGASDITPFFQGVVYAAWRIVQQSTWFVLPAAPRHDLLDMLGPLRALLYLLPWCLGGYIVWRSAPQRFRALCLQSPLLFVLACYFILYTVFEPFFRFTPMDTRDVTTALCLVLPFLVATLAAIPGRQARGWLMAYVMLNLGLFSVLWARGPGSGTARLLTTAPPRLLDLPNHHRALFGFVQPREDAIVLTPEALSQEATGLFWVPYEVQALGDVEAWLETGTCTARSPRYVVLMDWDVPFSNPPVSLRPELDRIEARIQQKCPEARPTRFTDSVVYRID